MGKRCVNILCNVLLISTIIVGMPSLANSLQDAYNYLLELKNGPAAMEQGYVAWKETKKKEWAQSNKGSLAVQILDLITDIPHYLKHEANTNALYAYNYLRELKNQSLATDISQVNQNWATEQGYVPWKEEKEKQWIQKNIKGFARQITDLITDIPYYRSKNSYEIYALYAYNDLREILNKSTIQDLSKIDEQWLSEVTKVADVFDTMERNEYQPASVSQKALIKEAQEIIGLQKEIGMFSTGTEHEAYASTGFIALCDTPDLDQRLATVYHELGHIVHKDVINQESIDTGNKPLQEFLDNPEFKADLEILKQYVALGSKAFDNNSDMGRYVNNIVKIFPWKPDNPYWVAPQDQSEYNKSVFARAKEQRADLYMLNELFKQNLINAIFKDMNYHRWQNYIIAESVTKYPSNFERLLYEAGFLVAHNINVNVELQKWENRGICIDSEKLYHSKTPFASDRSDEGQGAIDFLRAYHQWQKAHQAEDYQQWKEQLKSKSYESETIKSFQSRLKWYFDYFSNMFKKEPFNAYLKREKLYAYNYLRELKNQPLATDVTQIDQNWVAQQQ